MTLGEAIEFLEKAKNELDNLRLEAENKEKWDFDDSMCIYIEDVQSIIDSLEEGESDE